MLTRTTPTRASASTWRPALAASAAATTAYAAGWTIALSILKSIGTDPHPVAILGLTHLTPLGTGLLLRWLPGLRRAGAAGETGNWTAQIISLNVGFAALFPLTMIVDTRILSTIPPATSPYFWGSLALVSLLALLAQLPIQVWMRRRSPIGRPAAVPNPVLLAALPLRSAWPIMAVSVMALIGSLALTISQLA